MKINEQQHLMLEIFFIAISICLSFLYLLNYINDKTIVILYGVTPLFLWFDNITMPQKKDSKGISNLNKIVGIFYIISGVVIVISVIVKIIT